MAGTIPISMTQQFTSAGVPLVGGKLFIFQTATTTPQNAYSDSGLTTALPNPITLDSSGRVPPFFLADGTIKVRLTDSAGVIQVEYDNLLVIGPSGGGGGGGATVDPTAILQTGMVLWLDQSGPLTGFVRDNAKTIGSSTSGATERANSDTQSLFTYLWNTFSNTQCPVAGGRGASPASDWAASKTIQLPDKRFVMPIGLSDMGNTDSGRAAGVTFSQGNATTAGSIGGEAFHALGISEVPVITPSGIVNLSNNVGIPISAGGTATMQGGPTFPGVPIGVGGIGSLGAAFAGNPFGGGASHNNMPPFVTGTFYRKL